MDFSKFEEIFENYVNSFIEKAKGDEQRVLNLTNKKIHSYYVRDNIVKIAKEEKLNVDTFIVEFIGLFHDIGRFYQFDKYETFNDAKSENHAKLSVKVLEDEGIIHMVDYDKRAYIIDSILNHNLQDLPKIEDNKMYIYSSLLRDADKLDGFRTITIYEKENKNLAYFKDKSDEPVISKEILDNIFNHKTIYKYNMKTILEAQITTVAYITCDIIYDATIREIKKNDYVEKMFNMIQDTPDSRRVHDFVNEYIEERLNSKNS